MAGPYGRGTAPLQTVYDPSTQVNMTVNSDGSINISQVAVIEVEELATPATDHSGTITSGGVAQQIMAANTSRVEAWVYNPDASETLWINVSGGTAAANAVGSIGLPPLTGWSGSVTNAVSGIAATTSHKYTAGER